jgi:Uri superfamily endonuclease
MDVVSIMAFTGSRLASEVDRPSPTGFGAPERRGIMEQRPRARSYQLHILVKKAVTVVVGRLGSFEFPAGEYVYTGSGGRNIQARVSRHLSRAKKLKWHIDHLLTNPEAEIVDVKMSEETECVLNQKTAGHVLVPGFGASDCRNRCRSHLKYIGAG